MRFLQLLHLQLDVAITDMSVINENLLHFIRSPLLPRITSTLIGLMMGWWAVDQVLPLLIDDKSKNTIASISTGPPAAIANKQLPLNILNLFGIVENKAAVNKASTTKVTKLKLTLRGILATEDPKQGVAQIQNAKNEERHFVVSDSVFGQATLEEIHIDRVILLHNGHYETLVLPEKFLDTKHFSVENQALERKQLATNFRKMFLNHDVERLRKLFGFDTAWKNGGFIGFIVKALSDEGLEMMSKLGVNDGDLIVVVNGLRFSESLDASQQLTELKTATSVDVIIDRNGEEIPFHFDFDSPIADKVAFDSNNANSNSDPTAPRRQPSGNITPNNNVNGSPGTSDNPDGEDVKDDEDLGEDWDDSEEAEAFKIKQRERTTINITPVEYDH